MELVEVQKTNLIYERDKGLYKSFKLLEENNRVTLEEIIESCLDESAFKGRWKISESFPKHKKIEIERAIL